MTDTTTDLAAAMQQAVRDGVAKADMTAEGVLLSVAELLAERGATYDAQDGATRAGRERSMARTVAAFNALHGTQLTEAQGWSFMLCLKLVRLFCAPGFHKDSALDAAAYAVLLAEGKAHE